VERFAEFFRGILRFNFGLFAEKLVNFDYNVSPFALSSFHEVVIHLMKIQFFLEFFVLLTNFLIFAEFFKILLIFFHGSFDETLFY